MDLEGRLCRRFPTEELAPPEEPAPRGEGDLAVRFFEEEVGPLSAVQERRLRLLVTRFGEPAVVRALAEAVILEMNDAVLRLVRDRLLKRLALN